MSRRYDVGRTGVTLLASLLAAIGAYSAVARLPVVPAADTAVLLLATETAAALALALWPNRGWSARRRAIGLIVAAAGLVLMLPGPIISAIVVPGCICPGAAEYSPYGLLGIGHQYWMIVGMIGCPAFIAFASLLPTRRRSYETPDEPGA